jgi:ketosteroid isomerase-like protein
MSFFLELGENVMRRMLIVALLSVAVIVPAWAMDVTEQDLMQAATELGRQYDTNYNAKNAVGMAGLYAGGGVLISPGQVVRGTTEVQKYYQSRFDLGATGHRTKIIEVHVQGDGGYGVGQFSVTVPASGGGTREMPGNVAMVYHHGADGWHLRLMAISVPPPPSN